MTKKKLYFLIALSILATLIAVPFLKHALGGRNTNISISENKNEVNISAEFPKEKSKAVQDYLRKKLNLADLPDLNHLEIKHYSTPDKLMNFYIKSRPGYVKLSLDKGDNDLNAYKKMKETGEEIKKVLAE